VSPPGKTAGITGIARYRVQPAILSAVLLIFCLFLSTASR